MAPIVFNTLLGPKWLQRLYVLADATPCLQLEMHLASRKNQLRCTFVVLTSTFIMLFQWDHTTCDIKQIWTQFTRWLAPSSGQIGQSIP